MHDIYLYYLAYSFIVRPGYKVNVDLIQKFVNFYHRYENLNLKITFFLISFQILDLYWLTTDVVLQKIFGHSFFMVPKNLLPIFVVIDYIEIPALISGLVFHSYNIRREKSTANKSYLFLGLLGYKLFIFSGLPMKLYTLVFSNPV